MILIILILSVLLYITPANKGLSPMSILLGIDCGSLDGLSGMALSGKLIENVKLVIHPFKDRERAPSNTALCCLVRYLVT